MTLSTPSSPTHRRRRSSNLSEQSTPVNVTSTSRRSSLYSPGSRRSSRAFTGDGTTDIQSPVGGDNNGLGSLADELADAWEEDEAVDESMSELNSSQVDGHYNDRRGSLSLSTSNPKGQQANAPRDSGIGVDSPKTEPGSPNSKRRNSKARHSRKISRRHSQYDGSEQGNIPEHSQSQSREAQTEDIPASLKTCIADVEALAKGPLGTPTTTLPLKEQDKQHDQPQEADTITRTLTLLKDLTPQSNLENSTTRLITAHTALTSNLAHQTRNLHSLSYALISPLSQPPDTDTIDTLLPLLSSTLASLPQPSISALSALVHLSDTSRDTISALAQLSDTLHLSRQTTGTATRRLKAAREVVAEMRREELAGEVGVKFIEDGQWGRRLAGRECKGVCEEVVGGFEEVCRGFRERLERSAGAEVGVA